MSKRKRKTPAKVNERDALFVEGIPQDIRNAFKAACYRRGTTMKKALQEFMIKFDAETRK